MKTLQNHLKCFMVVSHSQLSYLRCIAALLNMHCGKRTQPTPITLCQGCRVVCHDFHGCLATHYKAAHHVLSSIIVVSPTMLSGVIVGPPRLVVGAVLKPPSMLCCGIVVLFRGRTSHNTKCPIPEHFSKGVVGVRILL